MEEFFNSLGNARDKARRNHYKCLCPSCNKNAINSHIIQQHPYLESIAEKGLLYQIKDNEINPRSGVFSDNKEQFLSLRQVLSMPLFCSEHDNQLFKPIESGEIDFDSALTFLLFSFRGLSSQRYLEEKRQILYQNTGFEGEPFDVQREYSQHVIERFDCTIKLIYRDICNHGYDDYVFKSFNLPFMPICGSDVVVDEDEIVDSYYGGNYQARPINTLYLTLLPIGDKTALKLIIGYHKQFVSKRQIQFYQQVSKAPSVNTVFDLIYRMKNWCCSPSLFKGTDFASVYELNRIKIVMKEGGC